MNYLIIYNNEAFYESVFDFDESYKEGMTIFNLITNMYTVNGFNWFEIVEDTI